MHIITLALISAIGIIILLSKVFKFRRVVRHHRAVDILCTCGLPWLFFGSFSGMATAIIAGVIISAFLWIVNRLTVL